MSHFQALIEMSGKLYDRIGGLAGELMGLLPEYEGEELGILQELIVECGVTRTLLEFVGEVDPMITTPRVQAALDQVTLRIKALRLDEE